MHNPPMERTARIYAMPYVPPSYARSSAEPLRDRPKSSDAYQASRLVEQNEEAINISLNKFVCKSATVSAALLHFAAARCR